MQFGWESQDPRSVVALIMLIVVFPGVAVREQVSPIPVSASSVAASESFVSFLSVLKYISKSQFVK